MKDKKIKEQLKVIERGIKKSNASRSSALKTLKKAGIVTKSGNLTKKYKSK